MEKNHAGDRYEQLSQDLLERFEWLRRGNRKRVKYGSILLLLLAPALFIIRWMTDSDKVVFLMIYILCFIMLAIFLIGVEYLDHLVQKNLREMIDREGEFDALLPTAETLHDKVAARVKGRRAGDGADGADREDGEDGDSQ